jgi:hypothetical protein
MVAGQWCLQGATVVLCIPLLKASRQLRTMLMCPSVCQKLRQWNSMEGDGRTKQGVADEGLTRCHGKLTSVAA